MKEEHSKAMTKLVYIANVCTTILVRPSHPVITRKD